MMKVFQNRIVHTKLHIYVTAIQLVMHVETYRMEFGYGRIIQLSQCREILHCNGPATTTGACHVV
jgi:hypothetical protein